MYTQPSSPRSIGGVLDDTIQLYKASFASCWVLSLLIAVASGAVSLFFRTPTGIPLTPTQQFAAMKAPSFLLVYLLLIGVSLLIYAAVTANVYAVSRGESPTLKSGLAVGVKAWPSTLAGVIVVAVIMICGTLLLIIPGIYLWNRLQLWIVAVAGEGHTAMQSLGTSWRLVAGNWWRTFAILTVLVIMFFVVFSVLGMIAGFAAAFFRVDVATTLLVTQAVSLVGSVFTVPAFPAALVAIYRDLKLRKEGGDLEARVSNLQPS